MNAARLMLLAMIAVGLAGCVAPRAIEPEETQPRVEPAETPPPAPEDTQPQTKLPVSPLAGDLERLVLYFDLIKKLPATDFVKEHDSARTAFTRTHSDFDRMRLAMVLSLPNTTLNDDQRAVDLLDPMVKNENSTLRGLAVLVSAHLQERRRLETSVQGLQQNVQKLQQKLDALMSLEKSLIDRDKSGPARKR